MFRGVVSAVDALLQQPPYTAFEPSFIDRVRARVSDALVRTHQSPAPKPAVRELLATATATTASFDVLTLDEQEAKARFSGHGVTGELHRHLPIIYAANPRLNPGEGPFSESHLRNVTLRHLLEARALMTTMNRYRVALGDAKAGEADWFEPFYAAMCRWSEHAFRASAGLPDAPRSDGLDAALGALHDASWMKFVSSDAADPRAAFEAAQAGQ